MNDPLAKKSLMTKSRMAFAVWLIIWASLTFIGIRLYSGVIAQKVPGYPKPEQLEFYVLFPVPLAIANILLIIFSRKFPFFFRVIAFVIQLFVLPAFIFYGSGGV